jgi:DNA-binding response OmpR family regulator
MITHLLVADSDPWLRNRCRGYFADRGSQVEVAADGLECLESLHRVPPDVLVLEWELPWGGGDGVLAFLREERFAWPRTVILTTTDCAVVVSRLEPPVAAMLCKPFCMAALSEEIRRAQYGETQLAAKFLRNAQDISVPERWRREWGPVFGPPRRPRMGGDW